MRDRALHSHPSPQDWTKLENEDAEGLVEVTYRSGTEPGKPPDVQVMARAIRTARAARSCYRVIVRAPAAPRAASPRARRGLAGRRGATRRAREAPPKQRARASTAHTPPPAPARPR